MISHKYRCILIHIPRTGGSSIERWIGGGDWWSVSPETKHLLASQAKQVYSEYWDDYFKFAFVRNPWDRVVSCLHYSCHFGIEAERTKKRIGWSQQEPIDFSGYKRIFGHPVTVEHDHRFYERSDLLSNHHRPNRVFLNIIDEPIDFVGRFETLKEDTQYIQERIGIEKPFNVHVQRSKRSNYERYCEDDTCEEVRQLYAGDIEAFGYKFETSKHRWRSKTPCA